MKKVWLVSWIISILAIGLMFLRWDLFIIKKEPTENNFEEIQQQIMIETKNDGLHITQKWIGLTIGEQYKMIIPKNSSLIDTDNKNQISKITKIEAPFLTATNTEMSIQYLVEHQDQSSAFLLNDWIPQLASTTITKTTIEIADSIRRKGTWITGIPLISYQKMNYIDYYVFEGSIAYPSLYWQSKSLNRIKGSADLTYYDEMKRDINELTFPSMQLIPEFPFKTIIMTDQVNETEGNGLLVVSNTIQLKDLENKIITSFYKQRFKRAEKPWLLDSLVALTTNQNGATTKGQQIAKELLDGLTKSEIQLFIQNINKDMIPITPKLLDKRLGETKGLHTRFFQLNSQNEQSWSRLYFLDSRKMIINQKLQKGINIIKEDDQDLYPVVQTLESLGYELQLKEDDLFITNHKDEHYQFFLNKHIFYYNNEAYGLLENPYMMIDEKIYTTKKWLQSLFNVSIEEQKDEVRLSL
ncbi:hypothetical protein [Bacillus sp. 03113]|uniref:hypothetical protein n=1 Tax=Bacillus sp. 03113 TaxID=2578211 RepID=UPI0011420DEA|nr:hypothetical protein [Bacillus sp. 03113]